MQLATLRSRRSRRYMDNRRDHRHAAQSTRRNAIPALRRADDGKAIAQLPPPTQTVVFTTAVSSKPVLIIGPTRCVRHRDCLPSFSTAVLHRLTSEPGTCGTPLRLVCRNYPARLIDKQAAPHQMKRGSRNRKPNVHYAQMSATLPADQPLRRPAESDLTCPAA